MNKVILFVSFLLIIWFFIPIYEKPRVLKSVLSEDECKHIQDIASKKLHTSTVSKSRDTDESIRKSETAWLKAGGFYKPHQDCFKDDKNKRMYTFIIALNDEYEGGETEFPNINKKYRLEKGDVLFFNTLNNYECVTKKALHGGTQVKSGEKWVCNLWVRKYKYP